MSNLPAYAPGQSARSAHQSLQQSLEILDRAQHCAVLWFGEIMRRELFRELGYSTMRAYALEELGFSSTRAGDFLRLAAKLDSLPEVQREVAAGRLGYTKAREIAKVADAQNEKQWLQVAQKNSRRKLEATVREAQQIAVRERKNDANQGELVPRPVPAAPPTAVPVRVGFEFTPSQYARYEALLAKMDHRGHPADLLLEMMETFLATTDIAPRGATGPHCQIHVHECPTCARTTVQTPRGEKELTPLEAETMLCDAQIHESGRRNTTTIPPRTRRKVLARDRHQCRRRGCPHTRYLHIHHLTPRAQGGGNESENLVTLCTACHELWHQKGGNLGAILAEAPAEVA